MVAELFLDFYEVDLNFGDLSDSVVMGWDFSHSKPINFKEAKEHCYQIWKEWVSCDEVFVHWYLSLDVLFVLLNIALENALK